MAIIVGGTKVVPVAGDTLIIKDSADANALKEIDFANIGVGNIVLTDTTLLVKTYTMYSDAGTANVIGTITVTDGVAGTGLSVPDYDNAKDYDQNEVVMEAGIFYRALTVGTNIGNAPAVSEANWEFVPVGGVATRHDVDAAYALNSIVIVGGAFFTPNVAIVADGNVAFVEGIAANEWSNILTVPFQLHDADALYANNDVVRVNNALFQANSAIDGTGTAVPFVEGVAANEWRVLGSVIPAVYQAPLTTTIEADTTHTFAVGCVRAIVEVVGAGCGNARMSTVAQNFLCSACGSGGYIKLQATGAACIGTAVVVVGVADTSARAATEVGLVGTPTSIVLAGVTIIGNGGANSGSTWAGTSIDLHGGMAGTTVEPAATGLEYLAGYSTRGGATVINDNLGQTGQGGSNPLGEGGISCIPGSSSKEGHQYIGIGFGFGAAAFVKGSTDANSPVQHPGGQGAVVITEYFS